MASLFSSLSSALSIIVCYFPIALLVHQLVVREAEDCLWFLSLAFACAVLLSALLNNGKPPAVDLLELTISPLFLYILGGEGGLKVFLYEYPIVFAIVVTTPLLQHTKHTHEAIAIFVLVLELLICSGCGLWLSLGMLIWVWYGSQVAKCLGPLPRQEVIFYHVLVSLALYDISTVDAIEVYGPRGAILVTEAAVLTLLAASALDHAIASWLIWLHTPRGIVLSAYITPQAARPGLSPAWRQRVYFLCLAAIMGSWSWPFLCHHLHTDPFSWLATLVMEHSVNTITFSLTVVGWVLGIGGGVWVGGELAARGWDKITTRKAFHALIVAMFYPMVHSPMLVFTCLSFGGAVCVFILLEQMRLSLFPDLCSALTQYYQQFLASNTSMVTAHLTLLLGIAMPFVYGCLLGDPLVRQLGFLTVGVGDAIAAVVGMRFGRLRWPGSSKTVEGSMAGFLAMVAVCLWMNPSITEDRHSLVMVMATLLLSSLIEVFADGNDNLLMPCCAVIVHQAWQRAFLS